MNKIKIEILILLTFLFFENCLAEIKLTKIIDNLKSPWSLTILDNKRYLITEKSGNILIFNKSKNKLKKIKHNLNILEDGQGGLLDILFYNNKIFISYSENKGNKKTSTSAARG